MNELDDSKKSKHKRPAMRLYTPPCNNNNSSIKRSDSLNDSSNKSYQDESKSENLSKEDYDHYKDNSKDNYSNGQLKNNRTVEDKLSDCFKKSLSINDHPKPSTSSKSTSPQPNHSSDDEFSNMLEVYDLSPELKSQDIRSSLYQLQTGDFEIKWVNESRAIIIFSTKSIANEALKLPCHNLKLRKLSQGGAESKQKARQCSTDLPFKQRPETSACLARRLVGSALGIRVSVSAEQREVERKKLQDARGIILINFIIW